MSEVKRTRRKIPDHLRGVTTSLRLRPDRLAKYKELGGVKWLNASLDHFIEHEKYAIDYSK